VTGRLRSFWKEVLAKLAQLVRDQTALEETVLEAVLLALSPNQPVIAQNSDSTDNALHALPDWSPVRMAKDVLPHKTARATTKSGIDAEHAHSAQLVHHQTNKEPHVLTPLFNNQLPDQTANATKLLTETTNVRTAHKDKPLIKAIKIASLQPKTNALEIKLEETSLTATDAKIANKEQLQISLEINALQLTSNP
jgi:hypothetical protein